MNRLFQKCLALAVYATGMALAQSQTAEDMPQACVPFTTQPLEPPTFAHPIPEAELKKCDAAALYYGFDRPPDFTAALQCGYYQRAHPDPGVDDPFAGPGVLSMLYANGKGVTRNYDLALRFACENPWIDRAELYAGIERIRRWREIAPTKSNFDLCDYGVSGLQQGACESVRQGFADAKRNKELQRIKAQWAASVQAAFKSLQNAETGFENTRAGNEVDLSGTGRVAFSLRERSRLRDQFLINLRRFARNDIPRTSAAAAQDLDRKLNLAYQQIQHSPADAWQSGTIKPEGIRDTQRAWLKLRNAWVAFARLAYPTLDTTSLIAQLTRLRLHQLPSLAPAAPAVSSRPRHSTVETTHSAARATAIPFSRTDATPDMES